METRLRQQHLLPASLVLAVHVVPGVGCRKVVALMILPSAILDQKPGLLQALNSRWRSMEGSHLEPPG